MPPFRVPAIRSLHDLDRRSALAALLFGGVAAVWAQEGAPALTADQALSKLLEGNARYVALKEEHPDESLNRRRELVSGQHPFAVVLGCSDSRVPPELLFDQGLGDLFVIRVAG